MQEIDGMDMPGFLKIRAWNARRKTTDKPRTAKAPKKSYIDTVWPGMRPR